MEKVKAFIIMFNRLTWPRKMAEFMSDTGCEVILVDNGSTYPPLVEWYKTCPYKVIYLNGNFGNYAVWTCNVIEKNYPGTRYCIITDHDLDLASVPKGYIDIFKHELAVTPGICKVGLSLELIDLPINPVTEKVRDYEKQFWTNTVGNNGFYDASVDTTFALYDQHKPHEGFYKAIRSPRPYTARHLPWYLTREEWNEEEHYYYEHANVNVRSVPASCWADTLKAS